MLTTCSSRPCEMSRTAVNIVSTWITVDSLLPDTVNQFCCTTAILAFYTHSTCTHTCRYNTLDNKSFAAAASQVSNNLPSYMWQDISYVSLQSASRRSRSPVLQCVTIFLPTSHQRRQLRPSDSASSRFCSLSLIWTFTPDSQSLHLCGPSNNWHYLGHTKNYDDDDDGNSTTEPLITSPHDSTFLQTARQS